MNRIFSSRRRFIAVALSAVIIAGAAGTAAAFFTSSGTGTGSATIASASAFDVVVSTPTGGPLAPGPLATAPTDNVAYTVTNPGSAASPAQLTTITIEVSPGFSYVDGNNDPACTASDFSINGLPVGTAGVYTVSDLLPIGGTFSSSFNIQMIDNGANQDSCEGGSVPLTVLAS